MLVQQFIKQYGLDALAEQKSVVVKRYENGYVKLNYDQIAGDKMDPVSMECRGLTLLVNPDNTSKVITRGFNRFFNWGEADTKDFDFSNCTVFSKEDGSLVLLSWSPLDNEWIISTRGMAYAEGNFTFSLTETGGTFRDWILRAMQLTSEEFQNIMKTFPKEVTYVMEYVGPENRVVTPYSESGMVLLAVIDNETGKEETLTVWQKVFQSMRMNVRLPQTFPAASGDELAKMADELPDLQEGFVVLDHNTGKRVKLKAKTYVALHQLRGSGVPSQTRLMELVLLGETEEVTTYFPEFQQFFDPLEAALHKLKCDSTAFYITRQWIESQKDFALEVKDQPFAAILFKARKDKIGAWDAFEGMELSQKVKLLEKFL